MRSLRASDQKRGRTEQYPLVRTVGDGVVYYLQRARPRRSHREIFVTLRAPFPPISQICVYATVSKRVRALRSRYSTEALTVCVTPVRAQGSSLVSVAKSKIVRWNSAFWHFLPQVLLACAVCGVTHIGDDSGADGIA